MKALKHTIEAGGEEATQGGENRTGQFSPGRAPAAAGFQKIPRPAGLRRAGVFEHSGATGATRGVLELWAAVLLQAIEDYHRKGSGYEVALNGIRLRGWYYDREMRRDKRRAEAWFKSTSEEVGSFLWICDILKLDPSRVWARIKERDFALTQ